MLPILARDTVHLLYAFLDAYPAAVFMPSLSPDERRRSEQFERVRDRDRYVVSRGLLRLTLGAVTQCGPAEVALSGNRYGKPLCKGLDFSVAHADDVWVCALSWVGSIGVDVENRQALKDRRIFQELVPLPDDSPVWQSDAAFLHWWTQQEAYAKATGVGFLRSFLQPVVHREWWNADFLIPGGALGAVVASEPRAELSIAPLISINHIRERLEASLETQRR